MILSKTIQFVNDYTGLNKQIACHHFALPSFQATIKNTSKLTCFTKLEINIGCGLLNYTSAKFMRVNKAKL